MTRPARALALELLGRIDEGAYANLATASLLASGQSADLSPADRHLVTTLVHGTTRLRRNLDFRVDAFVKGKLDDETRRVLRLGAYQLSALRIPSHAAVNETVKLAPHRSRGLVNAVMRRLAESGEQPTWPSDAVRLSYPDWIVERLRADLGPLADETLEAMNEAPEVHVRDDGYAQGRSSQLVAEAVTSSRGERVLDVCAAPGGKATAMARTGATVVAMDVHPNRTRLMAENARRVRARLLTLTADGIRLPFASGTFDYVLVDAPCSGLGALHRRPDARWRIQPDDIGELVDLQRRLLASSSAVLKPGGTLVYSVCTLTSAESTGIDGWLADAHPELSAIPRPSGPWRPLGRGGQLLPQDIGSDGMCLFRYRLMN